MHWLQSEPITIPRAPEVYSSFQGLDLGVFSGLFSMAGLLGLLGWLWDIYTVLAYLASLIFLVIYIYATIRWNEYLAIQAKLNRDEEDLYDEYYRGMKKHSRLEEVFMHSVSEDPNDWKLAIIEADVILDSVLKDRGYVGNSLGERLRNISPRQMKTLDDAWEAHKVRNQIAHAGADFVLTRRIAEETINRYQRVFTELGLG
jgi:uncharacterized membrane protein